MSEQTELVPCPACLGQTDCFICLANAVVPFAFAVEYALMGLADGRDAVERGWSKLVRELQHRHGLAPQTPRTG